MPRVFAVLLIAACAPAPEPIAGLDSAFGVEGRALVPVECPGLVDRVGAVVRTPRGYALAGGACGGWRVAAFDANGRPDPGFGNNGIARPYAPDSIGGSAQVKAMQARPDGTLLILGETPARQRLKQLTPSGAVDAAFSAALEESFGGAFPGNFTFGLQADGKVVLASLTDVLRVNVDGTLDSAFGRGGRATPINIGKDSGVSFVLPRADGTIAIVGTTARLGREVPFVAVLTAAGEADLSFGMQGRVEVGLDLFIEAAAIAPDGAIVLAGSDRSALIPILRRFTPAGAIDLAFGSGGRVDGVPAARGGSFAAVAVLPDGAIVAAGYARTSGPGVRWVVAAFAASGSPTRSPVLFDLEVPGTSYGASALAADADAIVVAGLAHVEVGPNRTEASFGLARIAK